MTKNDADFDADERRGLIEVRNDLLACPSGLRAQAVRLYFSEPPLTPAEVRLRRTEMSELWRRIVDSAIRNNGDVHEEALSRVIDIATACGWTNSRTGRGMAPL